jgi:hypothetical protein
MPQGHGDWQPDDALYQELREGDREGDGVEVAEPKVYDEASLRLLLDQARGRLVAINALNEAALIGRLGALAGSPP